VKMISFGGRSILVDMVAHISQKETRENFIRAFETIGYVYATLGL